MGGSCQNGIGLNRMRYLADVFCMLSSTRLLLLTALFGFNTLLFGCGPTGTAADPTAASAATQTVPAVATATATEPASTATALPPTPTHTPPPTATFTATASPPATATLAPTTAPTATASPTAAAPTEAASPSASTAELAAQGQQIYKEQYCGICHELDTVQSKGLFGPSHSDMAAVAAQRIAGPHYTGLATTPAEYIRESILDPPRYFVESYTSSAHPMPAYTHLTESQIEALVQFLLLQ